MQASDEGFCVGRHVICGVDDSRGGREALIVAAVLCQTLGLDLLSVHATGGDRACAGDHRFATLRAREMIDAAQEMLDRVAGSGGRDDGGARRIELGPPAERLAAVAEEEGAEFIVVGSRGRPRLRSALLGSVSRELLAVSPCPVLVVPPGATGAVRSRSDSAAGRTIVCGVDETAASRVAAEVAAKFARRMDLRLTLVHVYRARLLPSRVEVARRRAARSRLEAAAAELSAEIDAQITLERGDPVPELSRVAAKERAQLIVVGGSTGGQLAGLVSGSVSSELAGSAPAPVLVVADTGWREVSKGRVSRRVSAPRARLHLR